MAAAVADCGAVPSASTDCAANPRSRLVLAAACSACALRDGAANPDKSPAMGDFVTMDCESTDFVAPLGLACVGFGSAFGAGSTGCWATGLVGTDSICLPGGDGNTAPAEAGKYGICDSPSLLLVQKESAISSQFMTGSRSRDGRSSMNGSAAGSCSAAF